MARRRRRLLLGVLAGAVMASILLMQSLGAQLATRRAGRPGGSLRGLAIVQDEAGAIPQSQMVPQAQTGSTSSTSQPADAPDGVVTYGADDADGAPYDCELLFAIPTVARGGGTELNYLNVTLEALLCQLPPADTSPRVCIGVFEPRRPPPSAGQLAQPTPFELARKSLASRPEVRRRVRFVRPPPLELEPAANGEATEDDASLVAVMRRAERALESPGARTNRLAKTKRQTFDVARMLLSLQAHASSYLVLMEDDWLLCDGAMRAILYLLAKATIYHSRWAALRFSYGLNGIMMHTADLKPLARFLLDPAAEPDNDIPDAPVDHLTYRWLRGKYRGGRAYFGARRIVAFRHTLYWHVGDSSVVGNAKTRHKPKCYGVNREWLFEQEAFHVDKCPDDDVSPCDVRPAPGSDAARELRSLEESTLEAAPGAQRCDAHRVCWGRPAAGGRQAGAGGQPEDGGRRCASKLLCAAGGGAGQRTPCVPTLPEYSS